MARRVVGIAHSNQGDPNRGVEECRRAVEASTSSQMRALANLYLCVALLDAGYNNEAITTALDAVADGQITGLDQGFGGYFDALAAEALCRIGRWPEADAVLQRHPLPNTLPVGQLRLARTGALLAAGRGDTERALHFLDEAHTLQIDGWHHLVLTATTADVHLTLGSWNIARDAAEQGWRATQNHSALWATRFASFSITAIVELTLDRAARREAVDVPETVAHLRERLGATRNLAASIPNGPQLDTAAHLAQAAASLSRLGDPDADAWSLAAQLWTDLADQLAVGRARLGETEAAAAVGDADRATTSLRAAHSIASHLGALPLIAATEATAHRTRITLIPPARVHLDETDANRLGLTPREVEVLALITTGLTNRQIGNELYVSVKTASVHISNILRKLNVRTRVDAAAVAQRLGLA